MAGTTIDDGGAVYDALHLAVEEQGRGVAGGSADVDGREGAAIAPTLSISAVATRSPADKVAVAFGRFRTLLGRPLRRHAADRDRRRARRHRRPGRAGGRRADDGFACRGSSTSSTGVGAQAGDDASGVVVDACGDEVAAGRPAPYMIHRAMERGTLAAVFAGARHGRRDVDAAGRKREREACVTIGVLSGKLARGVVASPSTPCSARSSTCTPYLLEDCKRRRAGLGRARVYGRRQRHAGGPACAAGGVAETAQPR